MWLSLNLGAIDMWLYRTLPISVTDKDLVLSETNAPLSLGNFSKWKRQCLPHPYSKWHICFLSWCGGWYSLILSLSFYFCFFICLRSWGLNSVKPWAIPPALSCEGFFSFFWDRVSWTICLGWHRTLILLVSASWGARIIGVSHQCQLYFYFL
jgi:hypothetical protein